MFTVLGASGNIGGKITDALLLRGEKVRVVGRNPQKLAPFKERGAELYLGSLTDATFVTKCLKGCSAAFVMVPPDYHSENFKSSQQKISETIRDAIRNSGLHYVVNLSGFGAEHSSGTGIIQSLREHEQRLNRLESCHIMHLRPAFFMENLLNYIPTIRQSQKIMSSFKADLPIPMVASLDVARVAAECLLARNFTEKNARSILGPRDVSMAEVCLFLSRILEQKITYQQLSEKECENAFIQMRFSSEAAKQIVELYGAYNTGLINTLDARDENTTVGTRIEDFLRAFRGIFFDESDFGKHSGSYTEESPTQH
jgi:uncharacterized protein YbjT (DUF2867 family)